MEIKSPKLIILLGQFFEQDPENQVLGGIRKKPHTSGIEFQDIRRVHVSLIYFFKK